MSNCSIKKGITISSMNPNSARCILQTDQIMEGVLDMNIGYACLTIGVQHAGLKTCRQQNATDKKLMELIENNLTVLEAIIDYNIRSRIKLFRISSDIIPFGSSPVNRLSWPEDFSGHFERLGEKIKKNQIRVSMHPGQYTVLNSPNKDVVNRAVADLEYHTLFLDRLGVGPENKIVVHIGGIYGDKQQAMQSFIKEYRFLDSKVKSRLVIENDDRSYTIEDVLEISSHTGAPVIYDNLHNTLNCSDPEKTDADWITAVKDTWQMQDGPQKVHYSQQSLGNRPGSHSKSIRIDEFMDYYNALKPRELDIMLEVKDKNLSAVKCLTATSETPKIANIEKEWSRYKYTVLEHSPLIYRSIRELLKDKKEYPAVPFYRLIEAALEQETTTGNAVNAVQHVWGYFKDHVTEKEKSQLLKAVEDFQLNRIKLKKLKSLFHKLALKYEQPYLLDSLYFVL